MANKIYKIFTRYWIDIILACWYKVNIEKTNPLSLYLFQGALFAPLPFLVDTLL